MKKLSLQSNGEKIVFKEIFEEFIRFKTLQNLSPETLHYYDDCYRYFLDFFGEEAVCSGISEDTFYSYLSN